MDPTAPPRTTAPAIEVIQPGDSVVFDFGGKFQHYTADVTRTVHVGEPTEEYRRAYDTVLKANEAAVPIIARGSSVRQSTRPPGR